MYICRFLHLRPCAPVSASDTMVTLAAIGGTGRLKCCYAPVSGLRATVSSHPGASSSSSQLPPLEGSTCNGTGKMIVNADGVAVFILSLSSTLSCTSVSSVLQFQFAKNPRRKEKGFFLISLCNCLCKGKVGKSLLSLSANLSWLDPIKLRTPTILPTTGRVQKKTRKKKLTSVSLAFTHTSHIPL